MHREHDDGPRLGRYVLERRIAAGGMAEVFKARRADEPDAAPVAVKVLKTTVADEDTVRMFLREALVGADFQHPNLAQVYEVGSEGDKLFLAMELVRGVSAATLMHLLAAKGRSIPIPLAAKICADVLAGLAYAHEARGADGVALDLVHRDVSPQNILVTVDGVVKLVDFGIARAETALGRTQGLRIKGKFSYMAPEQWEPGRAIDARADVFALGVCLYEMSTGGGDSSRAAPRRSSTRPW
ncbi:MAG: serine/threonine-protein kinase [Polyangiales bacterium]